MKDSKSKALKGKKSTDVKVGGQKNCMYGTHPHPGGHEYHN